jgi:hypothetical protein
MIKQRYENCWKTSNPKLMHNKQMKRYPPRTELNSQIDHSVNVRILDIFRIMLCNEYLVSQHFLMYSAGHVMFASLFSRRTNAQ